MEYDTVFFFPWCLFKITKNCTDVNKVGVEHIEWTIVPSGLFSGPFLQLNHLQALIYSMTNVKMYGVWYRML